MAGNAQENFVMLQIVWKLLKKQQVLNIMHKIYNASNIQSTAINEVEAEEEMEIGRTMSSTSSRTSSTTSSSSSPSSDLNISTSIENSFISDNHSEEESQAGGMS